MSGLMCVSFFQEYIDGQLKNKYGDAFIRGNNGNQTSFISALWHQYMFLITKSTLLAGRSGSSRTLLICLFETPFAVLYISTVKAG